MKRESRYLSKLLRHNPENLEMDKNGYVSVDQVLSKLNITIDILNEIVESNDKQRFAYNDDKTKIRANQGHSLDVDIDDLKIMSTCSFLFHGTDANLNSVIMKEGLKKMNRQYVHMSYDLLTAKKVGKRKNKNVIIYYIDAGQMIKDGLEIFKSKNGVYLTDYVDPKYIVNQHFTK